MAQSFSITAASTTCKLGANRKADSTFTVTNATDRATRGQLKLRALDDTQATWLSIGGEKDRTQQVEHDFAPHGTWQVTATITVPAQTPAGKYNFRLDAISASQPDDDYTEGQVVSIEIPGDPGPVPTPPRWPYFVLAAVVALVAIGIGAWLFLARGVAVPNNLVGHPYDDASSAVKAAGLSPARKDETTNAASAGTVIALDPQSGTRIKKDTTVTLTVAQAPVAPTPPPEPPATAEFSNPLVRGIALDFCKQWGANCGKAAADAYCVTQSYAQATDLQIIPNDPPTLVIGTNQVCNSPNCTRISWVKCTKSNLGALTGLSSRRIELYLREKGALMGQ